VLRRIGSIVSGLRGRGAAHRMTERKRRRIADVGPADLAVIDEVWPYTRLSPERIHGFMEATRYVARHRVPGVIVECGVWKGGAVMASIRALQSLGVADREYWLYDTFEGMPEPEAVDRRFDGVAAAKWFRESRIDDHSSHWCRAEYDEVRANVLGTGYDPGRIRFVKGLVEDTLPGTIPEQIAILRLDTDFYASTKHELEHLFPLVVRGGVLIIDDYGFWEGARRAVDEYLAAQAVPILLNRTDRTGRVGVKP